MAVHDFRSQRLFVEHDLREHKCFEVSREQANYLLNVLRLKQGSEILAFNGRHGEWCCRIEPTGRKACTLEPVELMREQPPKGSLEYAFAPLKQARLDYMVQKAVEMGADILQPVLTERTQVRTLKESRMHGNCVEAAEQCGILNLPESRLPISLEDYVAAGKKTHRIIFCDEDLARRGSEQSLAKSSGLAVSVLIGPEGGFSDHERELLLRQDNVTAINLGPRILRADTAAVAALTLVQSTIGDW